MSSRLSIKAEDSDGDPLSNFPMKVTLDEGLRIASGPSPIRQKLIMSSDREMKVETDADGYAVIPFNFNERQPNSLLILLGKSPLPSRDIEIMPLRSLPKGSKLIVSVPNP